MDISSQKTFTKTVKSWIAYDAGNSAFATTVVAAFFPIFYLEFWASTMPKVEASIYLNWTLVICNSLILLSGPVIGAYTDINRSTKSALNMFTIVGALFVGSLFFIDVGSWLLSENQPAGFYGNINCRILLLLTMPTAVGSYS